MNTNFKTIRNVLLGGVAAAGLLVVPGSATPVDADGSARVCYAKDESGFAYALISDGFYQEHGCRVLHHEYKDSSGSRYAPSFSFYASCRNDAGRDVTLEQCFNAGTRVITSSDWEEVTESDWDDLAGDCLKRGVEWADQAQVVGDCLSD